MSQQHADKTRKKRSPRARRAIKRAVKGVAVVLVLGVAGLFGLKAAITRQASAKETTSYSRAAVARGEMSQTVYGTGTTSARSQPNVLAETEGTLTDLRVSVGDTVQKGDILAVLLNEDVDDEITELEYKLWDLDETIQSTAAGSKATTIDAPAAGRVMALYANAGDDALAVFRREGALAIISTDGRMKVVLNDVSAAAGVALDDRVAVAGEGFTIEGTITDLTRQGTCVTVTVLSDELPMDAPVTVTTMAGDALGTGTLAVNKPLAVSSYGGTIASVRVSVGQKVSRKETLFKIVDSPLTLTLENLRLQRETAAKSLADAKAKRENLIVLAPCDGTVATVSVSEGDEITSGTLLCSILEGEDMNLTIAVDELDVVSVAVGQKVAITVDALSGVAMAGEVSKIAPVGSSSGGVTTYDVELTLDAAGTGVRSGMNATGEIEIGHTADTLYVPVEALMTIGDATYVMVADASGASQAQPTFGDALGATALAAEGEGQTPTSMDAPTMPEGMERPSLPEGMDASSLPEGMQRGMGGERGTRRGSDPSTNAADASGASTARSQSAAEDTGNVFTRLYDELRAWLYDGVPVAEQVSGTLVPVTVGMQNDDYAEILSGVSEGDVVLYTATSSSSTNSFGMMGMGGSMSGGNRGGNMGGGPMGF